MKSLPSIELFKKTFTNGVGLPDWKFKEQYGNVSFEDAYPKYIQNITAHFETRDKINAFELFLSGVCEMSQSNISESRYYSYNGMKYRFSDHIYPTGSMTSDFCIDFAANPEKIHEINF